MLKVPVPNLPDRTDLSNTHLTVELLAEGNHVPIAAVCLALAGLVQGNPDQQWVNCITARDPESGKWKFPTPHPPLGLGGEPLPREGPLPAPPTYSALAVARPPPARTAGRRSLRPQVHLTLCAHNCGRRSKPMSGPHLRVRVIGTRGFSGNLLPTVASLELRVLDTIYAHPLPHQPEARTSPSHMVTRTTPLISLSQLADADSGTPRTSSKVKPPKPLNFLSPRAAAASGTGDMAEGICFPIPAGRHRGQFPKLELRVLDRHHTLPHPLPLTIVLRKDP